MVLNPDLPEESVSVCVDNSDADSLLAGADSIAPAIESSVSVNIEAPEEEQGEKGNGKSPPSWMDGSRDWGLKSLFSDSPTVHVHAQKRGVSGKGRGKKGYSPVDSTSSRGRQRKVPGHLQDCKY